MSGDRRNPRAKWTLPDTIDPPDRLCFTVPVPNNKYHIAAFRGALWNLASAINWQDDPDHKAKEVAKVWREIYDEVFPCEDCDHESTGIEVEDDEMNLRIKPDNPCIIQIRCGEDDWEDWYNPTACFIKGSAEPSPEGELAAGECKTFHVNLRGADRYLLPIQVAAGYTITITNAVGGWWNGDVLEPWACPNGGIYALLCASTGSFDGGSPVPSQPVGRLVAQIDSNYFDAFNTIISPISGTTLTNMYFQMNDAALGDNQGSITFDVEVCAGAAPGISVSYEQGSGITSPVVDTNYVLSSDDGEFFDCATYYRLAFLIDPCSTVTIHSLTGWTLFNCSSGNTIWFTTDCDDVDVNHHVSDGVPTPPFPATAAYKKVAIVSATPFTAVVSFS